jgi:hypothetical protein
MPSELPPLPDMSQPSGFDLDQYNRIKQVNADPVGIPLHHTKIDAEQCFEDTTTTVLGLDGSRSWMFLGFAYALIRGLDRSLFELYAAAGGVTLDVVTVQLDKPVCGLTDAFNQNPWAYKVQGVPQALGSSIIDFLSSYRFHLRAQEDSRRKMNPELNYCLNWTQLRVADPTVPGEKRPVSIWFALPVNLTAKRAVVLDEGPGLFLNPPVFRMEATNG